MKRQLVEQSELGQVDAAVRGVVARIAGVSDPAAINADADVYRDLGVKSTAALDLLITLEEKLDVSIPDQSFGNARTVSALAALVRNLLCD